MRRRGSFIVLVGPDGVGKTSVAVELLVRTGGVYFHFRPPLWRRWHRPIAGEIRDVSSRPPTSLFGSVARLGVNFVRFWMGYLVSVRPTLRSGTTVVADRWAYGYLAKPADLQYFGPRALARRAIALLPQPDLVASLSAEPETIVSRKPELDLAAAIRDSLEWSSLPLKRLRHFDAMKSTETVASEILAAIGGQPGSSPSDGK